MCDLGIVLGLAAGAATAVGEADAAKKNTRMIQQQKNLEYAAQERERLVETDAANKEGAQAQLEADRVASTVRAAGEGMGGSTAVERNAEQQRQGALSIANAKDRTQAANANYAMAGKNTQIAAQNRINTIQPNPFTMFANVATSGLQGYGAFK